MASIIENRKSLHQQVTDIETRYQALEEQLSRIQPLANLGIAWAMTAHELNNLLTPVQNYSQLALQHTDDTALTRKALEKTQRLTEHAGRILDKVMSLANPGQFEKQEYSLSILFDNVFDCIGRDFSKDKIKVLRQVDHDLMIWADMNSIQQVLLNLILNAHHSMKERGGVLTVSACEQDEYTRIEVSDTGCGIEADKLNTIFTAFYTNGKKNGNGLGLAFCRKVIESHDGCISVDSQVDQGSCFRILLPKSSQ